MKKDVAVIAAALLLLSSQCIAQIPDSVICRFEKIATAELTDEGKFLTKGDNSDGDVVFSKRKSDSPVGVGNMSTTTLHVLRRSKDAVWLAEYPADDVVVMVTLFFKPGIVMHTKHEILRTPFGFVEIGKCRPVK